MCRKNSSKCHYEQKSALNAIAMQLRWSLAACTSTSASPQISFRSSSVRPSKFLLVAENIVFQRYRWEAVIEASRLNDESDEPGLTYSIAVATIGQLEAALKAIRADPLPERALQGVQEVAVAAPPEFIDPTLWKSLAETPPNA